MRRCFLPTRLANLDVEETVQKGRGGGSIEQESRPPFLLEERGSPVASLPHVMRELSPFGSAGVPPGDEGFLPLAERERMAAVEAGEGLTSRGVL